MKSIKEKKNLIVVNDLTEHKLIDISPSTAKQYKKQLAEGDAYLISGQAISMIKMVSED